MHPHFGAKPLERSKPRIWCYYLSINDQRVAMRHGAGKVLAKLNGGTLRRFFNVHLGNARIVKSAELTDIEIYRVTEDIGEEKNLAGKEPEELRRLSGLLRTAYEELIAGSHVWNLGE